MLKRIIVRKSSAQAFCFLPRLSCVVAKPCLVFTSMSCRSFSARRCAPVLLLCSSVLRGFGRIQAWWLVGLVARRADGIRWPWMNSAGGLGPLTAYRQNRVSIFFRSGQQIHANPSGCLRTLRVPGLLATSKVRTQTEEGSHPNGHGAVGAVVRCRWPLMVLIPSTLP